MILAAAFLSADDAVSPLGAGRLFHYSLPVRGKALYIEHLLHNSLKRIFKFSVPKHNFKYIKIQSVEVQTCKNTIK
jgi:hypothetical protein